MNKNLKAGNQGGFTLIELVVVITILGILAATAIPKFVSMTSEARVASMKAVAGSLNTASGLAHARWMMDGGVATAASTTVEGNTVPLTTGYPTAGTMMATIAGLNASDYTVTVASSGNTMTVNFPTSVSNCNVTYTGITGSATAPVVSLTSSGC